MLFIIAKYIENKLYHVFNIKKNKLAPIAPIYDTAVTDADTDTDTDAETDTDTDAETDAETDYDTVTTIPRGYSTQEELYNLV
jgi:hypothetical protein